MTKYSEHVQDLRTPQHEKARSDQAANNAGGFSFTVDKWTRLDRFLVLGAEGGTYYVGERKLTKDNASCIRECLAEDGLKVVARIVEISDQGRAPKNDPAIFALAMCAGAIDPKTRAAALAAIPKVCRIGTHLFHFAQDVEGFRRWGRSLRKAVAAWYTDKNSDNLALQVIKYQQRDGWSHKDLLRLSHASAKPDSRHAAIFRYVTKGVAGMVQDEEARPRKASGVKNAEQGRVKNERSSGAIGMGQLMTRASKGISTKELPPIIQAFEEIHMDGIGVGTACQLIRSHNLPHECVPNEMKNQPEIWEALSENMGITALIRNLGKMTSIGLIKPLSSTEKRIAATLMDPEVLKKGRIHPLTILYALKTYESGRGIKGSLTWDPSRAIVDAMNEAFYLSFKNVEPTGKNYLLALDVSGSMGSPMPGTSLSCRDASAALAMVTARTEENWHCVGFTASARGYNYGYGRSIASDLDGISPLAISPRQRLDDIVKTVSNLNFGNTDCALPMLYAQKHKLEVDVFMVFTDSETWAGNIHPFQALRNYRQASGRNAKLVVVGMTATEFTIADPTDAGMLDVVGFDTSVPGIVRDFVKG